jgi:hypothetical protein
MRRLAIPTLLAVLWSAPAAGQPLPSPSEPAPSSPSGACAPEKLTRMVVRNISPGLAAAAPAAQPRSIWRKGSMQLRTEEVPDPVRGVHNILVVSEPDIWVINMAARAGQHSLDPGPVYEVRAPILPLGPGMPPQLMQLEYGCEAAFAALHAPASERTVSWGAETARLHVANFGDHQVTVMLHARRNAPLMIVYARAGQAVFAIRYDEFRGDLPDRPDLFQPPKNVRITEAPPSPQGRPQPGATPPLGDRL